MSAHLLVVVTAHGYGHATQTAPVVNSLRRMLPGLRLTLMTAVPRTLLESRFEGPFELVERSSDIGFIMSSALDPDVEETARAYRRLHAGWEEAVEREAALVSSFAPDLVLANVPYLPVAAARRCGVPAAALCSLNWAAIHHGYITGTAEAERIHEEMLAAYNDAAVFLRPEPGMPMAGLSNLRDIGPVAAIGTDRRAEIDARFGLVAGEKLVVVQFGGVDAAVPLETWPAIDGVRWLTPAPANRPDMIAIEALALPFIDILRSADAVVTKPGYGTFAEAACNGTRVLYVTRGAWPEEPYLVAWLERRGCCLRVERDQVWSGDLGGALEDLFARPLPPWPLPSGSEDGALQLAALLGEAP